MLRSAARGSIPLFLSSIINLLLGFAISILLARFLDKEHYGAYQFINTINFFVIYTTSLGIDSIILRYAPEYLSRKQPGSVNQLLVGGLVLRLLAVACLFGTSLLFSSQIFSFFNFNESLIACYVLVCVYLGMARMSEVFGQTFMNVYFEQRRIAFVETSYMVIKVVSLLAIIHWGTSFKGIVYWLLATECYTFCFYAFFAVKKVRLNHREQKADPTPLPPIEYRRIGRFGLSSYLLSSTGMVREIMIDNFVIAHFYNLTQVGLYGFASSIVGLASNFNPSSALKNVFSTLLVKKYAETKNMAHLIYGNTITIKITTFVLLPIFLSIGVLLGPIIVHVFDAKLLPALTATRILLFFFFFNQLTYGFGHIFFVLERMDLRVYTFIFSIYNLGMDLFLVPRYGIVGAAMATGTTALLTYIYYYVAVKSFLKIDIVFPLNACVRVVCNMAPTLFLFWFTINRINGVISLLSVIATGAALYLGSSYLFKPFDRLDRDYINAAFGRKVWVF